MPRRQLGLHHLALRVPAVTPALRRFYVDLLGFELEREVPGEELWLTSGLDSLVFLPGTPTGAPDHFGFMVPAAEDVGAWEATLRAAGVTILEPTEHYDDNSVGMICLDPAGHHVQLLWHPRSCARLASSSAAL